MPLPPGDTTGRVRLRPTFFGRLVLQVECEAYSPDSLMPRPNYWRDATEHDLYRVRIIRERKDMGPIL